MSPRRPASPGSPVVPDSGEIRRVLRLLDRWRSRYVLGGGAALHRWAPPYRLKDLDIVLVRPGDAEAGNLFGLLKGRGYSPYRPVVDGGRLRWRGLSRLGPDAAEYLDFTPVRFRSHRLTIDLSTRLTGVPGDRIWRNRKRARVAGTEVWVVSRNDLVRNKLAILRDPKQRAAQRRKARNHLARLGVRTGDVLLSCRPADEKEKRLYRREKGAAEVLLRVRAPP